MRASTPAIVGAIAFAPAAQVVWPKVPNYMMASWQQVSTFNNISPSWMSNILQQQSSWGSSVETHFLKTKAEMVTGSVIFVFTY